MEPYAWQKPAIAQQEAALLKYGSVLQGSETGCGKTPMALDTCRRFGWRPAVLCPKVAIAGWKRTCDAMGLEPFFIDTYEKAIRGSTDWVSKVGKKAYRWHMPDDTLTIFDEVHKAKSYRSLTAALHLSHSAQGIASMNLSATVADNPLQLKAVGVALRLFKPSEYMEWMLSHGVTPGYWGGFEFKERNAALYLPAIHAQIFPDRGVRLRRSEVPDFPETQIIAECHEVMSKSLPKELDAIVKEYSTRAEQCLTDGKTMMEFNLRLRQATETAKLPLLVDLANEYLENGMSPVIFVSFKPSIDFLRAHFNGCAEVHGGQTLAERQANVTKFLRNETRVCLCNIAAGGVGVDLDDQQGGFPRAALICPTYSVVELKQALGRVHRASSKSKSLQRIIYAAGTIEEEICAAVSNKLDRLDLLNDGDIVNAIFKPNP